MPGFSPEAFIGKFFGPNKIKSIAPTDSLTPSGKMIFEVTYEGGQSEMIPTTMFEVVSDEASDYTALFLKKFEKIAPVVLTLFTDYGLAEFEVEHAVTQIKHSVNQSFNRALSYLWYKTDSQFVEGYDPKRSFTLVEADMVLRPIGGTAGATEVHMPVAKKNPDGIAASGA